MARRPAGGRVTSNASTLGVATPAVGAPQGDPQPGVLVGGDVGDRGAERYRRAHPAGQRPGEPLVPGRQGVHGAVAGMVDQQVVHAEQTAGAGRLGREVAVALHRREPLAARVVDVAEHVLERAPLPGVGVVLLPAGERVVRRRAQGRALLPEPSQAVHSAAAQQPFEGPVVPQDAIVDHEVRRAGEGPRLETQVADQPAQLGIAGYVVQLGDPGLVADARFGNPSRPHPPAGAVLRLPDVYVHLVVEAAFEQVCAQQPAEPRPDDPYASRHEYVPFRRPAFHRPPDRRREARVPGGSSHRGAARPPPGGGARPGSLIGPQSGAATRPCGRVGSFAGARRLGDDCRATPLPA